jgi:hypothetical protein
MSCRLVVICLVSLLMMSAQMAIAAERGVFVNGARLSTATLNVLQLTYRTPIAAGRYWYDPYSGLWGHDGGPAVGQIHAGLQLGGQLSEGASRGDTAVLVNGRRLPSVELRYLQSLFGPIRPGRYWLDAVGNAGFEGGPALVNIAAAARSAQGGASGYSGWNRNTLFGNWGGDGECTYYNAPNGSSVMAGNC